ncbi:MAG: UDP-3-O-(3-hydroxymyristoyl)glucosamine N-acyltransferase [Pikeienuella sp.]
MSHSIEEIARRTGLLAEGAHDLRIMRPAEPQAAGPDDLALAMSPRYAAALSEGQARAAVLWAGADWQALGLEAALFTPRPRLALALITEVFAPPEDLADGVHQTAVVDPTARLGDSVAVGPLAVIGREAVIGAGCKVHGQAMIGSGVIVGPNCEIGPGVRILRGSRLGANVTVQANSVIGAAGFSYVTPERGAVESVKTTGAVAEAARNAGLRRIGSLGGVEIGDSVDIGAGTTIDAGTIAPTRIGRETKIDNLVQIGHNCQIGETCLICGHVGLAGSVSIGDRAVLGGKVGISDNVKIGADVVIAGGSLVGNSIKPGTVAIGVPAVPRDQFYAQIAALRRLPKALEQLKAMRAKLGL